MTDSQAPIPLAVERGCNHDTGEGEAIRGGEGS